MTTEADRMKPIIVLPPNEMSPEDVEELRKNGICVVVAKNPTALRFLDPIPAAGQRDKIEQAAIELSRLILHGQINPQSASGTVDRANAAQWFVHLLSKGTPLDPKPQAKVEKEIFDAAKADEIRRIAREEAREERKAKRQAAAEAEEKAKKPK